MGKGERSRVKGIERFRVKDKKNGNGILFIVWLSRILFLCKVE